MANIDDAFRVDRISINDNVLIVDGSTDPRTGLGYEAPIGSLYLRSAVGEIYLKVSVSDFGWDKIGPGPIPTALLGNLASTGILDGGTLSVNVDPTKFDISAGIGIIVDNHTDVLNPTAQIITWSAMTAVTITNLLTADQTYVAITPSLTVLQSSVPFTGTEHKNNIAIGWIGHVTNTSIVSLIGGPDVAFDATARLADLSRAIGPFNVAGNIFTPNGVNLLINKTAGKTYRLGGNFAVTKKDPDVIQDPAHTPATFYYTWRDGTGGWNLGTSTSSIIPNLWDNGSGTLQTIPNGKYSVQVVKYLSGVSGVKTRIEFGQTLYPNLAAAHNKLPDPDAVSNPAFLDGVVRAYIALAANATDLSNIADVIFIEADKFGAGGGGTFSGSITDLQQAYLNSIQPEIVTNSTLGAVSIKEGAGVGGNLIEGYNSSNSLNFAVAVNGDISTTGNVDGRNVSLDGSTQDTHIADTSIHFTTINGLADVVITAPTDNQLLVYNFATSTWTNQDAGAADLQLQTEVDNIETASGGIFVQTTGTLQAGQFDAAVFGALGPLGPFTNVTTPLSLLDALYQIDQSVAATESDQFVKVSAADTTTGYLNDTLLVGSGLTKTINNPAANETLTLTVQQATVVGSPSPANDQILFVLPDATRAKNLSVETVTYQLTEAVISPLEWIQIGVAANALSAIVAPLNGTVIRATAHCASTGGNSKSIDLYINAINTVTIGTFTGAGEQSFTNTTLNVDFSAGDRLRLRGGAELGNIADTVITLYLKWRA